MTTVGAGPEPTNSQSLQGKDDPLFLSLLGFEKMSKSIKVRLSAPQVRYLLETLEQVEREYVGKPDSECTAIDLIRKQIYAAVWDAALPKLDKKAA